MGKIRIIFQLFLVIMMKIYVKHISAPWVEAKFFLAWEGYQGTPVYRERLTGLGFEYAFSAFLESKGEHKYYRRLKIAKEPILKWRMIFAPFTIPVPDMLQIASNSGVFEEKKLKKEAK